MSSKQTQKRQRATKFGNYIYKYKNSWYVFNITWHPLADHIECKTKRQAINLAYSWSFPNKRVELEVTYEELK